MGIAWEIGVLAGLERAGALDPSRVDVFVGTSAGSVVSTRLALGHSLEDLVEEQRKPSPTGPASGEARPRADMSVVMEIFGELRQAERVTPAVARVVGQKALAASTPPEDRWVASFEATLGKGTAWPERDLRIAALDCETGERRIWTSADADIVDPARAVASSCAVPGMFPPVTIGNGRYTDGGVWSGSNADVLVGDRLDAVLYVGPTAGQPQPSGRRAAMIASGRQAIDVEGDELEAAGTRLYRVATGTRFTEEIGLLNLMNPAFRERGVELGLEDGADADLAVTALLA